MAHIIIYNFLLLGAMASHGLNGIFSLGQYADESNLWYNATYSPSFCSSKVDTATPPCTFTNAMPLTNAEKSQEIYKGGCRTCSQSTEIRCSTSALHAKFSKYPNVWAAYCNDAYLVVWLQSGTGFTANLDAIPYPPGGTSIDGKACRTRTASSISVDTRGRAAVYMLCPVALPTSIPAQNNFAVGSSNGISFLYTGNPSGPPSYTLPADGAVGNTLPGQDIFPTFNNRGQYTPENCEVDYCNEHVGQGGGVPHLHGDPFGPSCLYSASNYSSLSAHPPHIGYSLDGFLIYGRHLAEDATGFNVSLDECGGHIHEGYAYHYHTQVLDLKVSSSFVPSAFGQTYCATTVGPFKCWKADLIAQPYFMFNRSSNQIIAKQPCCGSTAFYVAPYIAFSSGPGPGLGIPGNATQSWDSSPFKSQCGVMSDVFSASPSVTTTPTPTLTPTATPTFTSSSPSSSSPTPTMPFTPSSSLPPGSSPAKSSNLSVSATSTRSTYVSLTSLSPSSTPTYEFIRDTSPATTSADSGVLSLGAFIGIAASALVFLVLVVLLVRLWFSRRVAAAAKSSLTRHSPIMDENDDGLDRLADSQSQDSQNSHPGYFNPLVGVGSQSLPPNWVKRFAEDGSDDVWYENVETGQVEWEIPSDTSRSA